MRVNMIGITILPRSIKAMPILIMLFNLFFVFFFISLFYYFLLLFERGIRVWPQPVPVKTFVQEEIVLLLYILLLLQYPKERSAFARRLYRVKIFGGRRRVRPFKGFFVF
jgi:hypothetical protein